MEKTYNKVIAVSFVIAAALAGFVASVALTVLVNTWGSFARVANNNTVSHGIPIGVGAITFLALWLTPSIRNWAGDVAAEISKIVWPSIKDTRAMTIVVTFIIILTSIMFYLMDIVSSYIVEFILSLEI